jgi:hypothetical protein
MYPSKVDASFIGVVVIVRDRSVVVQTEDKGKISRVSYRQTRAHLWRNEFGRQCNLVAVAQERDAIRTVMAAGVR